MAVQFVLALHRSLKKGKQSSWFSVAREQNSVKIIFSSSGKNLKPRTKKIVVLLLWHEGLSPHKKSGDLIFRSGTDRSKIREVQPVLLLIQVKNLIPCLFYNKTKKSAFQSVYLHSFDILVLQFSFSEPRRPCRCQKTILCGIASSGMAMVTLLSCKKLQKLVTIARSRFMTTDRRAL